MLSSPVLEERQMKRVPLALATVCLLAACSSGPLVQTDRDPTARFDAYRTYAWKQEPPISNPLLKQRIVAAVDAELAGKGWQRAPEAVADVVLVGNVSSHDDVSLNYFYEGNTWNGWDWRPGGAPIRSVEMRSYRMGTFVLDMFDAKSKRAVWRAVAEGTVPESESQKNRDAMRAVQEMFRDFPPPGVASP